MLNKSSILNLINELPLHQIFTLKKQFILIGSAIILFFILFFFGKTVNVKKASLSNLQTISKLNFNIEKFITEEETHLTSSNQKKVNLLNQNLKKANQNSDLIKSNYELATFWRDSTHASEAYIFYLDNAVKLENSEKNLTFAAQLILNNLRSEENDAKLNWKSDISIELFEKALTINPNNVDAKIGLGSCYVFGKGRSGGPTETMKGIQQLLDVVKKDSTNMKAQLILGIGGLVSGQYPKAIERLQKVIAAEPKNIEAISFLADTYAAKGDKAEATKWYLQLKKMTKDASIIKEVDDRLKMLN